MTHEGRGPSLDHVGRVDEEIARIEREGETAKAQAFVGKQAWVRRSDGRFQKGYAVEVDAVTCRMKVSFDTGDMMGSRSVPLRDFLAWQEAHQDEERETPAVAESPFDKIERWRIDQSDVWVQRSSGARQKGKIVSASPATGMVLVGFENPQDSSGERLGKQVPIEELLAWQDQAE